MRLALALAIALFGATAMAKPAKRTQTTKKQKPVVEDTDDADDDDAPKKSKKAKKRTDDDDVARDEAPKRSKRSKKRTDDDDDVARDEAPKKSKRSKKRTDDNDVARDEAPKKSRRSKKRTDDDDVARNKPTTSNTKLTDDDEAKPASDEEASSAEDDEPRSKWVRSKADADRVAREDRSASVERRAELPRPHARWIALSVDDGIVMRKLRYHDDLASDGRSAGNYTATVNAIGVHLAARPFELPVELHVRGELFVGIPGSETTAGDRLPTHGNELTAGVRVPFGVVGLDLNGGRHAFRIDDEQMPAELVPDTRYLFVRGGGFARIPIGPVRFTASAGYRYLASTGKLGDAQWFPRQTGGGVDGEVGLELALGHGFSAFARGHARRYFFDFHSEPGDALIVGGALDHYFGIAAGLTASW